MGTDCGSVVRTSDSYTILTVPGGMSMGTDCGSVVRTSESYTVLTVPGGMSMGTYWGSVAQWLEHRTPIREDQVRILELPFRSSGNFVHSSLIQFTQQTVV